MPDTVPNITKIPAPRVALIDQRTGLISREWFRFFNNLYVVTGGETQGITQIINGGTGASTAEQALINLGAGSVTQVTGEGNVNGITLTGDVTTSGALSLGGTLVGIDLMNQTSGLLNLTSRASGVLDVSHGGTGLRVRPKIKVSTSDSTIASDEGWFVNNKTGSSCVVTLPDAADFQYRQITVKNLQAQTLVSASSNVVPLTGGAAGTAILPATIGAWATLVSDGTNWVVMQS